MALFPRIYFRKKRGVLSIFTRVPAERNAVSKKKKKKRGVKPISSGDPHKTFAGRRGAATIISKHQKAIKSSDRGPNNGP